MTTIYYNDPAAIVERVAAACVGRDAGSSAAHSVLSPRRELSLRPILER
jgi:hypothetical protein